jgi:quercetin dioxygenase-like cupin family protein
MDSANFETGKKFMFNGIVDYASAAVVSKTIIKKSTGTVTVFAFDKGEGLSEHTASFDALVQITDGTAEIKIDGNPVILHNGQSIVMPANIPHALFAIEKFKMVLTMIKE